MAINLLINRIYVWVSDLRWQVLSALILLHMGLTAAGFILAGEPMLSGKADVLEEIANFAYFYGTTAATIGYGDISPQTPMGRIFAAVFLFPVALVFFTQTPGKPRPSGRGGIGFLMLPVADCGHGP